MKNMFVPFLTGMVLFVYGLSIPVISLYILLIAFVALLLVNAFKVEYCKAFIERLLLLMLFAASYYVFTTIHGITGIKEAIRNILAITGAYALGFSITDGKTKEIYRTLPMVLLLMVTGYLTFSFLSVYSYLQTSGLIEIAERNAPSFWDGSEINAPGLGANASLGMCLLPVVFFGRSDECRSFFYSLVALPISLMFVAGVYINVALQNRTPFLATAVSVFLGISVYVYRQRTNPSKAINKLAIIGLLTGLAVYYLATTINLAQYNILTRFTEERLESSRYEAWKTMLASLHHSLLGGRAVKIEEAYVHNLWLDVIWDAGLVPFIFLAAFHLKHAVCFKNILKSGLPLLVVLMIVGLGTSFFMNFMQEPTLSASVPYFAASCFFLGLVLGMSQKLGNHKDSP